MVQLNPRQVIVVSSRESNHDNMLTIASHCRLSGQDKLYGISVSKIHFSHKLISASKTFCVNFLSYDQSEIAKGAGSISGSEGDKFSKLVIEKDDCGTIDCCRIKDAAAWLECEVIEEVPTGDHTFFIGKIIRAEENPERTELKRLMYVGDKTYSTTIR
ncbi:flavin reductase [Candidatus Woesearchaeota archaeon]|jgi:flavin reductase (DIM6/NTAB) family NADH-FMN oxidoreductase RutF|nr:flavin reductase [Candidatus Woesearchaeota archaeon]